MNILLVEPYFAGSHAQWATAYQKHSRHEIKIISLEGRYWKWRMHGGAVNLAKQYLEMNWQADLILASDMLDLALFLSLIRQKSPKVKAVLYFHENQLNYPWSPTDQDTKLKRDNHYAFINFSTALSADRIFFNSRYHQQAFLEALPDFLKQFPDYPELWTVENIRSKSNYLPLGIDLLKLDQHKPKEKQNNECPLLVWNHRWEYDKNPEVFFSVLVELSNEGVPYKLVILGERYRKYPKVFDDIRKSLAQHIVHWGFAESFVEYAKWLWKADILPVTSVHDFFGVSVVEAIYCGCTPLLPSRLAYPEHLPEKFREQLLYQDDRELKEKLRDLIEQPLQENPLLNQHVRTYDWHTLVNRYDEAFIF